jgi:hypothetical protein
MMNVKIMWINWLITVGISIPFLVLMQASWGLVAVVSLGLDGHKAIFHYEITVLLWLAVQNAANTAEALQC